MNSISTYPVYLSLPEDRKKEIDRLVQTYHFTYQQEKFLADSSADLALWQQGLLGDHADMEQAKGEGKQKAGNFCRLLQKSIDRLRKEPTDYSNFIPPEIHPDKYKDIMDMDDHIKLLGSCPCPKDGELTRCCNLKTLDAVQQCAFACSYCSIQSFYQSHEIRVVGNLKERLEKLELDEGTWHIGTGQSSDSLLWGNDYGTLDALNILCRRYPQLIIELKTKSARTDWMDTIRLDDHIVASWSLNAETIAKKEERLASPVIERLKAARKAADHHIPIGFHLHPIVMFKGWQEEYGKLVETITENFAPEEVVMVSLGTLTFTKSVLRKLRQEGRPSRILQMELSEVAGKYSYPLQTKEIFFPFIYSLFPESWKQEHTKPFYYLCMEDPSLWMPTFGYSYRNNSVFEQAMRTAYTEKVQTIAASKH
ncbi:MAG: radical SAM protein [Spirochaetia bacterium]|jgi:spore photoproduct lyase|nr:radical SAM protein [Spirochaetia bacterium]